MSDITGCPIKKSPKNFSISETENENERLSHVYSINTIIGNRAPSPCIKKTRTPCRKTLRRDNRGELALFLPNLAVYNHRSIWKKLNSFCLEFEELGMGVAFHSEIWEKKESKLHNYKINEMFEMKGISYISTPRPNRRGGGSAITCSNKSFYIKEISVPNPDNLEVTFATIRPKSENSPQFTLILCAVYSPPRSRKKSKLIDYISDTYHFLKSSKYPSAYFALGGDVNDLNVDLLLNISASFRQIVTLPTRGDKILSIIVTDLWKYYTTPEILPPLNPDIPGRGKPSDHSCPYARTYLDRSRPKEKNYDLKSIRTFPQSGIIEFGQWIQNENFDSVTKLESATEQVAALEKLVTDKVESIFPMKEIKIYKNDKEFMNDELRKIRRRKCREYRKHKKSEKYLKLQEEFINLKNKNSLKFIEKIEELKDCNPSQFYKKIKQVGARLGEDTTSTFTLPSHLEQNLDPAAAAEQMAKHFSKISQEYPPLNHESLPERVKEKIFHPNVFKNVPIIEEYEVYQKLSKKKIKNSTVPGDIPSKLKKEFLPEISKPMTHIFNTITASGEYPRQWVKEYVTPIPKTYPPETDEDLRNISLTADLSKNYEQFLSDWLLPYIKKKIDPGQFGGLTGHSTTHYLITLLNFILSETDTRHLPKAVMVALIDFSKAFNRINHSKVLVRLSDWGVPGWLLRILMSYLSERSMILRYKGAHSSRHLMPGGSPQGTLLGVLLYLVYVSDIGMEPPTPNDPIQGVIDLPSVLSPSPNCNGDEIRLKFVDDLSLAESINLNDKLQTNSQSNNFIPPDQSLLQKRLEHVNLAAITHEMKLNLSKTKIIPFNFTKKLTFEPKYFLDGQLIDVVQEIKLLGVTITSNAKWDSNTRDLIKKGNKRLWFLRRLKLLNASRTTLTNIYKLFCRSALEYCAPVWAGALTKKNSRDIERVQKNAYRIIYGKNYITYQDTLDEAGESTLNERRDFLSLKFAKKCLKTNFFSNWFQRGMATRNNKYFSEPQARTKRYNNSPIPYMIRLLNK